MALVATQESLHCIVEDAACLRRQVLQCSPVPVCGAAETGRCWDMLVGLTLPDQLALHDDLSNEFNTVW